MSAGDVASVPKATQAVSTVGARLRVLGPVGEFLRASRVGTFSTAQDSPLWPVPLGAPGSNELG